MENGTSVNQVTIESPVHCVRELQNSLENAIYIQSYFNAMICRESNEGFTNVYFTSFRLS